MSELPKFFGFGWGGLGRNTSNTTPAEQEPPQRFGEIKITKTPPAAPTVLTPLYSEPVMTSTPTPNASSSDSSESQTRQTISSDHSRDPPNPTTLSPATNEELPPSEPHTSEQDQSEPDTSTNRTVINTYNIVSLGSLFGVRSPQSTKSTTHQSAAYNSKSSASNPAVLPPDMPTASRTQQPQKEEDFLLQMREKRKSSDTDDDPLAWYHDDLLERLDDWNDDERYALQLFERRIEGGVDSLTEEEAELLMLLARDREEALQDEDELDEMLRRRDNGESYNSVRLHHLELLIKRRNAVGKILSDDEEEETLKLLDEAWEDALANRDELQDLLDRQESGQEIDLERLYELELLECDRLGENNFEEQERQDLEFFKRKRLDAKRDAEEYRLMLELKTTGVPVDEDRFYILELVEKRRVDQDLTKEELDDIAAFEQRRNEEHLDLIEMNAMKHDLENGHPIADERYRCLQLLTRTRQGESLNDQESQELEILLWRRDQVLRDSEELAGLLDKKQKGEEVDEDQVYLLDLVVRRHDGEQLTEEELDDVDLFQESRLRESRELDGMLEKVKLGEKVDEDRLYGLQLREKERLGEPLSREESEDIQFIDQVLTTVMPDSESCHGSVRANENATLLVREEGSENWDKFSRCSQDLNDVQRLHQELAKVGLPRTIRVHDAQEMSCSSRISVGSMDEDSYIQDLVAQRDHREEDRREETLEEALELYHIALQEKNMEEDEQLFIMIFDEVLKQVTEKAKDADREQDELIEREMAAFKLKHAQKEQIPEHLKTKPNGEAVIPVHTPAPVNSGSATEQTDLKTSDMYDVKAPLNRSLNEFPQDDAHEEIIENTHLSAAQGLHLEAKKAIDYRATDRLADYGLVVQNNEVSGGTDTASVPPQDCSSNVEEASVQFPLKEEERLVPSPETGADLLKQSDAEEQNELAELNDLYDRQDRGEDIDEDRLYELELFDRWRQGEDVNDDELEDLEFFQKQREVFATLKVELDELRARQASGTSINGDRMYFLEIADKKRRGKELSGEELDDLDQFLVEEEHQIFPEGNVIGKGSLSLAGSEEITAMVSPVVSKSCASDEGIGRALVRENKDAVFWGKSLRSDLIGDEIEENRAEIAIHENREDIRLFSAGIDSNAANKEGPSGPPFVVVDSSDMNFLRSVPTEARLNEIFPGAQDASADKIDTTRILSVASTKPPLDVNENVRSSPNWCHVVTTGVVENSSSLHRDVSVQNYQREETADNQPNFGSSNPITREHDDAQGLLPNAGVEGGPNEDKFPEEVSPGLSESRIGDAKPETLFELAELNDLYDRQDRGEDIDEDRLYELELFDRWRQGEDLNDDELEDLEFFQKQREVFATLKVELDELRARQASGTSINGDRMYFLEIADKKRRGKELSGEELEDLDRFLLEVTDVDIAEEKQEISDEKMDKSRLFPVQLLEGSSSGRGAPMELSALSCEAKTAWASKIDVNTPKDNQIYFPVAMSLESFKVDKQTLAKQLSENNFIDNTLEDETTPRMAMDSPSGRVDPGAAASIMGSPVSKATTNTDAQVAVQPPGLSTISRSGALQSIPAGSGQSGLSDHTETDLVDPLATNDLEEKAYEEELQARFREGERLNKDQLFELRTATRIRQGDEETEELSRIREGRLKGKVDQAELGEYIPDVEWEEIERMKQQRLDDQSDIDELKELQNRIKNDTNVDIEGIRSLEQKERPRLDKGLSDSGLYESELHGRLERGESLVDNATDKLSRFPQGRIEGILPSELPEKCHAKSSGIVIDPETIFGLELSERQSSNDILGLSDNGAILFTARTYCETGNATETDVPLERLRDKKKEETYLIDEIDREYMKDLYYRQSSTGPELDGDEKFELDVLQRAKDGDLLFEAELLQFEDLRESREERQRDRSDLDQIRILRDGGKEFDPKQLYELELLEKTRYRLSLDADEMFELDLVKKRRGGQEISTIELDKLERILRNRELRALDERALGDILEQQARGENIDGDHMYELLLLRRHRTGERLNKDELYEVALFLKRRQGNELTDDDLRGLEYRKLEREAIEKEAQQIFEIKKMRDEGELIDGDFLYELELFHRRRKLESLTDDDLAELGLFEKRRKGEDLTEEELDRLAALKSARLPRANDGDIEEQAEDDDGDSAYVKRQRRRVQKGERLHRDELTELELLERQRRGEEISPEELDELELLRKERHKIESSQLFHTWDMDVASYESSVTPEKPIKKQDKKVKKKKQSKPPKPPKPPREKKPKEKRMRKKKKHVVTVAQSASDDVGEEAAANNFRDVDGEEKPSAQLPSPAPRPLIPKKEETAKSGFFGRLIGKSKKELELEEMKRRQEELIKEQLKAMNMEEEIKAMEKEKELQETFVNDAVESKSRTDVSISSWETDTSYEESEEVEGSEQASEEDSQSEDSSVSSSSSSESLASASSHSLSNRMDTDEASLPQSVGRKSVITTESNSLFTTESVEMLSIPPHDTRSHGQKVDLIKTTSTSRASVSHASSIFTDTDTVNKLDQESGESERLSLPPRQITTRKKLSHTAETDGVSEVSDGSWVDKNDVSSRRQGLLSSASRSASNRRDARSGKSGVVTKSGLLSAHLRRQKREQQRRDRRKTVTRHGDEISLGSVVLKNISAVELLALQKSPQQSMNPLFSKNVEGDPSKLIRPWKDAMTELSFNQNLASRIRELSKKESEPPADDFFDGSNEIFNRSVFNFDPSFSSQRDENVHAQSDSLSGIQEDESESESTPEEIVGKAEEDSQTSMSYEAEQSFSLLGYDGIESKLASKKQDKEHEFNEAWETIEADRAVAAQMNQKRMMRLRDRAPGREEKKDEGPIEIPRLFLFEGEKFDGKKRSKKKKKELKKLSNTLSKEFRKAMREVFDSEDEDEYDRTFGERGEDERKPPSSRARRRDSNESMYDSGSHSSGSDVSDEEEDHPEESFDDDYLRRLRERSMQQEVKEMLYEKKISEDIPPSDDDSQASEISRGRPITTRSDSLASLGSARDLSSRKKRKKPRKNRSGEVVYDGIDPADVYAQELEKKKTRTTFTISDLRKEMEEMKQEAAASNFEDAFAGIAASNRSGFAEVKSPQGPGMTSKPFTKLKSQKPSGPGVDSLGALNMNARPSLGRETSFATHHSNVGLLGGGRKTFDANGKSTFSIGGNLAAAPIPEEDDEEEAFLAGLGASPDTHSTPGATKARLANMLTSFTAQVTTPPVSGRTRNSFRIGGFGAIGHKKPSSRSSASGNDRLGGDQSMGGIGGSLGVSGFPEPLPVPEMQDDYGSGQPQKKGLVKAAGKLKMTMMAWRKKPSHGAGAKLHDDDMEGGLLD